jgi:hypothetical protein
MRRSAPFLALVAALALAAGCGEDEADKADAPGAKQTTPLTTPTNVTPSANSATVPDVGNTTPTAPVGARDVIGSVSSGQQRAGYGFFELTPQEGGAPLQVGVTGAAGLGSADRAAILSERCAGKVRGRFRIQAPPTSETRFRWELVSAQLTQRYCGP